MNEPEGFTFRRRGKPWRLEEAYFDVLGEHGGVIFGEIVEDVPLFVEHCEAVAARLTLRGVGLTSKNAIG